MENSPISKVEGIEDRIKSIRGFSVLLDVELAELYGVKPSALIQAVRRNRNRFPDDFMFRLTCVQARSNSNRIGTAANRKIGIGRM